MTEQNRQVSREKAEMIYGLHSVIEALEAGKEFDKVFIRNGLHNERSRELLNILRNRNIPYQFVPQEKLQKITRKNHQGVIGMGSLIEYGSLEVLVPGLFEQGKTPFILALDGITDVRNMGALARTAECAGVDAMLIPIKGMAQINADAIKTSSGALHNLTVCRTENLAMSLDFLKNSGLRLIAASEKGEANYSSADLAGPIVLVVGSEEKGVSGSVLGVVDEEIRIPILGKTKSLNASVAGGILMYEVLRQRDQTK